MSDLHTRFKKFIAKSKIAIKSSRLQKIFIKEAEAIAEAKANLFKVKSPSFPLRPSSALKCKRALYYDLCDYFNPENRQVDPLNIRQHRVFGYGHIIEDFEVMQVHACPSLTVSYRQYRLDICQIHGIDISGSIDGIVWHKKTKTPYLTDFKSINTYGFSEVVKSGDPKPDNLAQLNLYLCSPGYAELMDELKVPKNKRGRGLLIYSNKNDQSFHWIEVRANQKLFDGTVSRLVQVYESYKKGEAPARDFATKRYPCSYCPHADIKCLLKDKDRKLKVNVDLNLDASEEDIILALWNSVGESSTYIYKNKLLEIEPLKTKWKLKIKEIGAENGNRKAPTRNRPNKAKKSVRRKKSNRRTSS